jgi:hypothetical protein
VAIEHQVLVARSEHEPQVMIAKISRELIDETSCSVGAFNNANGRILGAADPCPFMARKNDTSAAAPMATIHGLEAIQDSFFVKLMPSRARLQNDCDFARYPSGKKTLQVPVYWDRFQLSTGNPQVRQWGQRVCAGVL